MIEKWQEGPPAECLIDKMTQAEKALVLEKTGLTSEELYAIARLKEYGDRGGPSLQAILEEVQLNRTPYPEDPHQRKDDDFLQRLRQSKLNEGDRSILYLRHQEGMNYAKIAEMLGINEGTARQRASRAERRLQGAKGWVERTGEQLSSEQEQSVPPFSPM